MANISTYLANKLLDHSWGRAAYTMPTVYVALFTVVPTMPGGTGGTEVSGGSYARQPLAGLLAAAASGAIATNADLLWATATADWGTLAGVGLLDALTVGNLLNAGPLAVQKTIGTGDTFKLSAGNLADALV